MTNESNAFIRQAQDAAADDAVRAIVGVDPVQPPDDPDEEALFQAHMRRFGQAGTTIGREK